MKQYELRLIKKYMVQLQQFNHRLALYAKYGQHLSAQELIDSHNEDLDRFCEWLDDFNITTEGN
jgi:hypothetical protein